MVPDTPGRFFQFPPPVFLAPLLKPIGGNWTVRDDWAVLGYCFYCKEIEQNGARHPWAFFFCFRRRFSSRR